MNYGRMGAQVFIDKAEQVVTALAGTTGEQEIGIEAAEPWMEPMKIIGLPAEKWQV
ncbi:MAG: hypothetical protein OXE40_19320 [Gammaproteobacteria bacterium]|nr:hypothetical protein [Gammaproteobacteria bacterium]